MYESCTNLKWGVYIFVVLFIWPAPNANKADVTYYTEDDIQDRTFLNFGISKNCMKLSQFDQRISTLKKMF